MPIPERTWYGYFQPGGPDKSNGTNPRYGKICPLRYRQVEGRIKDLKIGDIIELQWVKKYQHSATMKVTKVNNKSVTAVECAGSYGQGTIWRLHQASNFLVSDLYNSDERLTELATLWN